MKLIFKQRFFSWFDSYDIYDENGNTLYTVKGQLSWGHLLKIFEASGREAGMVRERILTFMPQFELYSDGDYIGRIRREFTLFKPRYVIDFSGWRVQGNFIEWDYSVTDEYGYGIATVSKLLFRWTDTYSIDVADPCNALYVLMLVLAIDAEKCSR